MNAVRRTARVRRTPGQWWRYGSPSTRPVSPPGTSYAAAPESLRRAQPARPTSPSLSHSSFSSPSPSPSPPHKRHATVRHAPQFDDIEPEQPQQPPAPIGDEHHADVASRANVQAQQSTPVVNHGTPTTQAQTQTHSKGTPGSRKRTPHAAKRTQPRTHPLGTTALEKRTPCVTPHATQATPTETERQTHSHSTPASQKLIPRAGQGIQAQTLSHDAQTTAERPAVPGQAVAHRENVWRIAAPDHGVVRGGLQGEQRVRSPAVRVPQGKARRHGSRAANRGVRVKVRDKLFYRVASSAEKAINAGSWVNVTANIPPSFSVNEDKTQLMTFISQRIEDSITRGRKDGKNNDAEDSTSPYKALESYARGLNESIAGEQGNEETDQKNKSARPRKETKDKAKKRDRPL